MHKTKTSNAMRKAELHHLDFCTLTVIHPLDSAPMSCISSIIHILNSILSTRLSCFALADVSAMVFLTIFSAYHRDDDTTVDAAGAIEIS